MDRRDFLRKSAIDLINEQLALFAGLPEEQMGLGHAFEMDPELENGFLFELAQAQLPWLIQIYLFCCHRKVR